MQRHSFTALNSNFVVDSEYQFVKELGQGAYGCVVAARHRQSGEGCAIKKITNINTKVRLNDLAFVHCLRGLLKAYPYQKMSERDPVSAVSTCSVTDIEYTDKAPAPFPWPQKCLAFSPVNMHPC
jgi:serine/threonine protein kinase